MNRQTNRRTTHVYIYRQCVISKTLGEACPQKKLNDKNLSKNHTMLVAVDDLLTLQLFHCSKFDVATDRQTCFSEAAVTLINQQKKNQHCVTKFLKVNVKITNLMITDGKWK